MKIRVKKQIVAEHNARYEADLKRRNEAKRFVNLLKAPKANEEQTV